MLLDVPQLPVTNMVIKHTHRKKKCKLHNTCHICLGKHQEFNMADNTSVRSVAGAFSLSLALCLLSWYDSWPGTDGRHPAKAGRKLEAPQWLLYRKNPLLKNNCYFESAMCQRRRHLEGRDRAQRKKHMLLLLG